MSSRATTPSFLLMAAGGISLQNLTQRDGITLGGGALSGAGTGGGLATTGDKDAVAIGKGANASNANDTALGAAANASGGGATAIGAGSDASESKSVAVGGSTASLAVREGGPAWAPQKIRPESTRYETLTPSLTFASTPAFGKPRVGAILAFKLEATARSACAESIERIFLVNYVPVIPVYVAQAGIVGSMTAIPYTVPHDHDTEAVLKTVNRSGSNASAGRCPRENDGIDPARTKRQSEVGPKERACNLFDDDCFSADRRDFRTKSAKRIVGLQEFQCRHLFHPDRSVGNV
ncbi:hypothetical protein HYPP_00648 [Hyphomicrobium sp. ghe19]|nr:hypothetical protein HYPP_00648 [Hyphomicrobium sp. ghe19]